MSWGQVYIFWWLCIPSVAVSALTYAVSASGSQFIVVCLIASFFGLSVLAISFQIVKNVYDKSYAQKIFFWNIRKKAGELANLHALLLVVRRSCLIVGIGMTSSSPLGILFILTLLTIYIISNWLISKALKKMVMIQILAQILFGIFMVLLQMSIINATTLDNQMWTALGWIMFLLAFVAIGLLSGMVVVQIVRSVQKYRDSSKEKSQKEVENQQEIRISQMSKNSRHIFDGSGSRDGKGQTENERSDQTQQQLLRMTSQTLKAKQRKENRE